MVDFIKAGVENRIEYLRSLGQAGEPFYDGSDIKWFYTGSSIMNTIFAAKLSEESLASGIENILSNFKNWDVPVTWLIDPLAKPGNLREQAESHGFVMLLTYGMIMNLEQKREELTIPQKFHVECGKDLDLIQRWCQVTLDGFQIPNEMRESLQQILLASVSNSEFPYQLYLGYMDGRAVSAASLLPAKGAIGVYWVATIPEARNKRAAYYLMNKVLEDDRGPGFSIAVLQSTEMGHKLYKKLRFLDFYLESVYEWKP